MKELTLHWNMSGHYTSIKVGKHLLAWYRHIEKHKWRVNLSTIRSYLAGEL